MTNKNSEYEKLTQEIYQVIHNREGFETIIVQHDVLIKGKSGQEHQIDVYWEFIIGGQTYRVAIECKNYNSKVPIGKIRDFHSVIQDIGNIQGIVVSKLGFQSGAIEYASHYGIHLKEIRFPQKDDWEDRIKTIVIEGTFLAKNIIKTEFIFDLEWFRDKHPELIGQTITIKYFGVNNEIHIYDLNGNIKTNLYEIEKKLPYVNEETDNLEYVYEDNDVFIKTNDYGFVKIKGIKFLYKIDAHKMKSIIDADEIVKAIIKSVDNGEIQFIFKDR